MLFQLFLILVSAGSIAIGLFLSLKPSSAIEFQKKFYEQINWRIEPVSMSKEIRNTRIMGLFLIIAALATVLLSLSCY
ncbi:MAG: hypothetical protein Q8R05_05070 [Candidatus Omnitrophota bacterium]|nr:hypothetical protein [Candidatus Omnitrophota bacterium]